MTTPLPIAPVDVAATTQILLKLGEMGTQLAVIHEQLKDLPDHEQRIRTLETSKARLYGGVVVLSVVAGGGAGWVSLLLSHR